MRVLHVQYTNPGAYPPLIRGAQLLAESGAQVVMLGVQVAGLDALRVADASGVSVRLMSSAGQGWRLKAHYARYAAWVAREGATWRPDWIYASDVLSAPIALMLAAITGASVVYHEHDAPSLEHDSWTIRRCLAARRRLVRQAAIVLRSVGQILDVADYVVPRVADCPAFKRWQFWQVDGLKRRQSAPQLCQRIGRVESLLAAGVFHGDVPAVSSQLQERLKRQETVAADFFAPHDAFEEAGMSARVEQMKRSHRRQRVGQQPAIDGHELLAGSQSLEGVKLRKVGHASHRNTPREPPTSAVTP